MASVAPQAAPSPPPPPQVSHDPTAFYGNDLSALPIADHDSMPRPALSEIWKAADIAGRADLPSAAKERQYSAWEPVIDRLNAGRPILQRFHNPGSGGPNAEILLTDDEGSPIFGAPTPGSLEMRAWNGVLAARQADPHAFPDLPGTLDEFRASVIPGAKAQLQAARGTLDRSLGLLGNATALASGVVTSFRNPINIAALAYGGAETTVAKRVLGMALANAGAEAVSQPFAARSRAEIGETLTPAEAATNIGTAFVGGAVLQGAGEVLAPGVSWLAQAAQARLGSRMTPVEHAAANVLTQDAEVAATSPFTRGAGTEDHSQRLDQAREVLNTAPQEALNSLPPPQPLGDARDVFKAHVRVAESGGNDAATNPRSSAAGRYQFTDDTWLRTYRARFGDQGSNASVLAKKRDPALQEQLMDDLTAHNAGALDRIGADQSAGNLYLMHFAGETGGRRILQAAPDEAIEHLLTPAAINANPFLKGKTAEEVIAWAGKRMGDSTGPRLRPELFGSSDELATAQRLVDEETAALDRANREADAAAQPSAVPVDNAAGDFTPPRATVPASAVDDVHLSGVFLNQEGRPGFNVEDPHGDGHYASAVFRDESGAPKGVARYPVTPEARELTPGVSTYVDPAYRRQGVATRLYDDLRAAGHDVDRISGTDDLTPDGAAFVGARRERLAAQQIEAPKPSRVPRNSPARDRAPVELRRFLAEQGGIGDVEGHDLAGGRDLQSFVPGQGMLIRKGGMSIDRARELAAEAGYFHHAGPDDAMANTTTADFLRLLDDTGGGRDHYALSDLGRVADREDARAYQVNLDRDLSGYDDPYHGSGAMSAMESLEHDLRMDAANDPAATVRLSDEGQPQLVSDVLKDLDDDASALAAARRCMLPPTRAA